MGDKTPAELLTSRRVWKAAVSRHINTLKRHLSEEDETSVRDRLGKLKETFTKFEQSHEEYHSLLEVEKDIADSDAYFFEVEDTYAAVVKQANDFLRPFTVPKDVPVKEDKVAAVSNPSCTSNELANLINMPRLEIKKFNGDPLQYHVFISMFQESVKGIADNKVKLNRLIQWTCDKAYDAIKACALMEGDSGYDKACTTLKDRFGSDHLVCERMIQNVRQGKPLRAAEDLQVLADELSQCFLILKQMDKVHEVESQRCIVEIADRLQNYLKNRWKREAMDIKRNTGRYPCFEQFVKFVTKEAQDATDPVYGNQPSKSSNQGNSSKPKNSSSFSSSVSTTSRHPTKCLICSEDHRLFYCMGFKAMKPCERLQFVKTNKLCENCLLSNHATANCRRQTVCTVPGCGKRHTKFIHVDSRNSPVVARESIQLINANVNIDSGVHMPVVGVSVNGKQEVCALLDTASTNTFCSKDLVEKLGLKGLHVSYNLNTLSKTNESISSHVVNLELSSLDGSENLSISNVYVVDEIPLKTSCPNVHEMPHLSGLQFVAGGQNVQLLIGQDNSEALVPLEVRRGCAGEPFASRTLFGWAINGPARSDGALSKSVVTHFISGNNDTVESDIHRLWEMECESQGELVMSQEDKRVQDLWDHEIKLIDGHYELPIPWRDDVVLPNNVQVAICRLNALRKKLLRCGLMDRYQSEIMKLLQAGYAEVVPESEVEKSDGVWYLPHHAVLNEKKPDKVRVVYDCAAKFQGQSLNDKCYQGPDYINKLLSVLIRFRQHEYAIMADIESMYYQVRIPPHQRDCLRFLWFDDSGLVTHYRMTSHVFGGIWCASSTTHALRRTLQDFEASPIVYDVVLRNFYVDDCLCSVPSESEALEVIQGTKQLLGEAGFRLTKFVVNHPGILESVSLEDRAKEVKEFGPDCRSRVLGIKWDVVTDELYFETKLDNDGRISRRSMLSKIASMYDPLGVLGPVMILGKMLLQEATRRKLAWDDVIPPDLADRWISWLRFLEDLSLIRVPRCVKPRDCNDAALELHHFCDASESAYGCCTYLRCVKKDGTINTELLFSKARVAPLKMVSIPRLELQAAVLSVQADRMLRSELDIDLLQSHFWTDSEIVLKYVNNETKRFQTFVGNRVAKIRDISDPSQWHHIRGVDNPADIISRGCDVGSLNLSQWFHGPEYLMSHKCDWSISVCDVSLSDEDPGIKSECKVKSVTSCLVVEDNPTEKLVSYYSDWNRLRRAVGWILRLKQVLRSKVSVPHKDLTVSELQQAELAVVKFVQLQTYGSEIKLLSKGEPVGKSSAIRDLSPFMDEFGVVRVGGRLKNGNVGANQKYPCILPHSHHVALLLVQYHHGIAHLGSEWVVSQLRQKYWITRVRLLVKNVRRQCMKCKKLFDEPCSQRMADLPPERLEPYKPSFSFTAVDCFGPIFIKQGRAEIKRYGCMYTCLTTRAIHIEKLNSMDTDSFLNSFRRFICRRGSPERVFSDNGTNFVGGKSEINKAHKAIDNESVLRFSQNEGVDWVFIPPTASHMGGIWERMVRTVKKVMMGLVDNACRITDEILETLFCEIERIVNGRPLTKLSEDVNDLAPLSPNHLLLLRECVAVPPGVFHDADLYKRRWRVIQFFADQFWRRWLKEYIPELQRRNKWQNTQRNLQIGDLVLLCDESTPRGVWPMGLIQEIYHGKDDLVRSVKIRTKASTFVRPVTKCVLLEACT